MSKTDEIIEEWLDNLWEVAAEVESAYRNNEYTKAQYIEEREEAIKESLKQILAAPKESV